MNMSTERECMLTTSGSQKIVRVEIVNNGQGIKYYTVPQLKSEKEKPQPGSKEFEEMFPIVDIEKVSLEDSFMQYEPETERGKRVKASIIEAKRIGMKNFRIPAMDPSLDDDEETIIYSAGREPAIGKPPMWWYKNAPRYMPNKNSRMRDNREHDVVLGVMLIKYLVEEKGYKVADAWKAVCVDSKDLGHYTNSKNAKKLKFEKTGSRQIGKCFDLGNTVKIVIERGTTLGFASGFVLCGGRYAHNGNYYPLASASSIFCYYYSNECYDGVGALVLDE